MWTLTFKGFHSSEYLFACSPHLVILSSIILLSIIEANSWVGLCACFKLTGIFFLFLIDLIQCRLFSGEGSMFWAAETLLYEDVSDKLTNWQILRKEGWWEVARMGVKMLHTDEKSTRKRQETMGKTWYSNVSEGAMNGWKDRKWKAGGECHKWSEPEMWRYHHPGNRMAAVLEPRGDFLFVSSIQEVRGP